MRRRTGPAVIDLHSHILPGLDDGARTLEESVAIARTAASEGIRAIAATPHVRDDFPTTAAAMERGVAAVRAALAAESVSVQLLTGGEIAHDYVGRIAADELRRFGLGGTEEYLLVEFPYRDWPLGLPDTIFRLRTAGMTPVIAHPERNPDVQDAPEKLRELVDLGALVQLTAASIDGRGGSRAQRASFSLLRAGLAHLVSTDAHAPDVRAVGFAAARATLRDEDLGRWLMEDVPSAIVAGSPLPPRPELAPGRARRWLRRRTRG